ncbi:MAG: SET domain-containing protein-lysine N-methyltransferase [Methanobacteriota archaeon]|nr:MAG: SET domain-containing protein-lysine N-methyltransferase [Euryarchaeota archaeon]
MTYAASWSAGAPRPVVMISTLERIWPIEVRECEDGSGRGVFARATDAAARCMPAGTLILANAPAAVASLPTSGYCDTCILQRAPNRCARCKVACYCSRACQLAGWKGEGHAAACTSTAALSHSLPHHALVKLKTIQKLMTKSLLKSAFTATSVKLETHGVYVPSWADVAAQATLPARAAVGDDVEAHGAESDALLRVALENKWVSSEPGLVEEARHALRTFDCNNFMVVDDLMHPRGAGVFPAGALLNHSCAPNCVPMYLPSTHPEVVALQAKDMPPLVAPLVQVFRTTRAVSAGEQLCHSYVELAATQQQRRHELQDAYGFTCCCTVCAACDAGSPPDIERWMQASADARTVVVPFDARHLSLPACFYTSTTGCALTVHAPPLSIHELLSGLRSADAADVEGLDMLRAVDAARQLLAALRHGGDDKHADKRATHAPLTNATIVSLLRLLPSNSLTDAALRATVSSTDAEARTLSVSEACHAALRAGLHALHLDTAISGSALAGQYLLLNDGPAAVSQCMAALRHHAHVYQRVGAHPMTPMIAFTAADSLLEAVTAEDDTLVRAWSPSRHRRAQLVMLFGDAQLTGGDAACAPASDVGEVHSYGWPIWWAAILAGTGDATALGAGSGSGRASSGGAASTKPVRLRRADLAAVAAALYRLCARICASTHGARHEFTLLAQERLVSASAYAGSV